MFCLLEDKKRLMHTPAFFYNFLIDLLFYLCHSALSIKSQDTDKKLIQNLKNTS